METLNALIKMAGVVQLGIVLVAIWVPRVLDWRTQLNPLHPFMKRLVWVYAVFIMFVVASFGLLSLMHADAIASGLPLGRTLAGIIGVFWFMRLLVQMFVFDIRPLVKHPLPLFGFKCFTVAFVYLAIVYGFAAVLPAVVL